ncbi:MAG: ABC transporter permease [Geminicoccaceae bacterium]|jgi:ribose transport system permease protein|nr:ABC transporter permease [Geminicoccaceae bacterium]
MSGTAGRRLALVVLQNAPLIAFVVVLVIFASLSDRFLTLGNFTNIVTQSSHIAIMAIGITFVLLTAGIDLSVGAVMYVGVAILALYLGDLPVVVSFPLVALIGLALGAVNGFFVVQMRGLHPFIITLAMLFILRGAALWMTDTRMVFVAEPIMSLGRTSYLGVPWAIWMFAAVFALAWIVLRETPFGRQVYAVGQDPVAAGKAGINVPLVLFAVYCICGLCAALGGLVSIAQVAAASSTFGFQKEFPVIAAAVLGGTSLFGGRGGVIGTVFGAILIQTVENGLVMTNANPYIYPLVTATIIFLAVLIDSQRTRILEAMGRRKIRVEEA